MLDKIRSHAFKVTHSIIAEWTLSKLVFHINYISTRNNPLTNNIQLVRWTLNFLEVKWRRFTIYLMHCLNYPKTFFLWFLLFQPVDPIEPRAYIISEGRNHVHCLRIPFAAARLSCLELSWWLLHSTGREGVEIERALTISSSAVFVPWPKNWDVS